MLERKGTWGAFLTPRHPGADGLPPTLPWGQAPHCCHHKASSAGLWQFDSPLICFLSRGYSPCLAFPSPWLVFGAGRPTRSPAVCAGILLSSRRPAQRSHLPLKSFKAGGFQTPDAISVIRLCFRKGFWTKDVARPAWPGLLRRAVSRLPSAGVSGPHGQLQPVVRGRFQARFFTKHLVHWGYRPHSRSQGTGQRHTWRASGCRCATPGLCLRSQEPTLPSLPPSLSSGMGRPSGGRGAFRGPVGFGVLHTGLQAHLSS